MRVCPEDLEKDAGTKERGGEARYYSGLSIHSNTVEQKCVLAFGADNCNKSFFSSASSYTPNHDLTTSCVHYNIMTCINFHF
jgi:hypothetical protein